MFGLPPLSVYIDTTSQDDTEPEQEALPETLPNVQGDVYVPPASRGGAYVPPAAREGGAYVPPHAKRGAGGGAYVPPGLRRGGGRGSKAPPDLKSSVAFPSLHNVTKKGDDRYIHVTPIVNIVLL